MERFYEIITVKFYRGDRNSVLDDQIQTLDLDFSIKKMVLKKPSIKKHDNYKIHHSNTPTSSSRQPGTLNTRLYDAMSDDRFLTTPSTPSMSARRISNGQHTTRNIDGVYGFYDNSFEPTLHQDVLQTINTTDNNQSKNSYRSVRSSGDVSLLTSTNKTVPRHKSSIFHTQQTIQPTTLDIIESGLSHSSPYVHPEKSYEYPNAKQSFMLS